MSLARRLEVLERASRDAQPDSRCRTCRFPRKRAPGVLILRAGEKVAPCPTCGRDVGRDGRALACQWQGRELPGRVICLGRAMAQLPFMPD